MNYFNRTIFATIIIVQFVFNVNGQNRQQVVAPDNYSFKSQDFLKKTQCIILEGIAIIEKNRKLDVDEDVIVASIVAVDSINNIIKIAVSYIANDYELDLVEPFSYINLNGRHVIIKSSFSNQLISKSYFPKISAEISQFLKTRVLFDTSRPLSGCLYESITVAITIHNGKKESTLYTSMSVPSEFKIKDAVRKKDSVKRITYHENDTLLCVDSLLNLIEK